MITHFNTIEKTATAEFKDRGSRFIAYAYPLGKVEEFKILIQQLKKEHPKAAHHCFAYRLGTDGNTFRVSDDGEPSGTAGKPILGQIDSKGLTNIAVVVVRYFGGTLLGVPGLISAYKTVTALVLQTVPQVMRSIEDEYILHFDYADLNEIMRLVKQYNCTVIEQEIALFPMMKIGVPRARKEEIILKLDDLRNVKMTPVAKN